MKNYKLLKIKARTPEWHKFRQGAKVGSSEIRTVMYSDEYTDMVSLYYKKLGMKPDIFDNEAMLYGREHEDTIANMWQYWDGKVDDFGRKNYLNNYNQGKIMRRCRNMNGIVQNPEYPYLFGDPDKIINKTGGFNLLTGEPLEKEGVLEIKTAESWSTNKWKYDIDPAYYYQLQGYMMLLGLDYGEIVVLVNGRYLDVYPFERDESVMNNIYTNVTNFCVNHVQPALQHAVNYKQAQISGDKVLMEESMAAIHSFEPDPGDAASYEQFVKEKFLSQEITIQGTEELLTFASIDKQLAHMKGYIEKLKQANKNKILNVIDHSQCDVIDFGDRGTMKFFTRKGATLPQLGNNVKIEFEKESLELQLKGLLIT